MQTNPDKQKSQKNHADDQTATPFETRDVLVYDLPVRISHWLMAVLFVAAFGIAQLLDDESPGFSYHMLLGFTLAFVVSLRIVWGLIGSPTARFSSMPLHPKHLFNYFKSFVGGPAQKYFAHNPASAWAALLMFFLSLGLAFTGYQMSHGLQYKEVFEEMHELFANAFLITVIAHITGVVLHTLRHHPITGEMIALAMINGKKIAEKPTRHAQDTKASADRDVRSESPLKSSYPIVALLLVVLVSSFAFSLVKGYDVKTQTLNFFGQTLQLGENESGEHGENLNGSEHEGGHENEHEDNDED